MLYGVIDTFDAFDYFTGLILYITMGTIHNRENFLSSHRQHFGKLCFLITGKMRGKQKSPKTNH